MELSLIKGKGRFNTLRVQLFESTARSRISSTGLQSRKSEGRNTFLPSPRLVFEIRGAVHFASLSSQTRSPSFYNTQLTLSLLSSPVHGPKTMQFLSRFSSSKAKDPSASSSSKAHRRHSTPPPSAQSTSYLPLDLPSSSFLRDDSLSVPFGISPKPSRSRLIGQEEEGLTASGSSRSVDT